MNKEKKLKKTIKHSENKFPPIIAKKEVVQCMYCKHYSAHRKECKLYTDNFPMQRKPNDFCSYGVIAPLWLEKMGYTAEEISAMQTDTDKQDDDILKELLK